MQDVMISAKKKDIIQLARRRLICTSGHLRICSDGWSYINFINQLYLVFYSTASRGIMVGDYADLFLSCTTEESQLVVHLSIGIENQMQPPMESGESGGSVDRPLDYSLSILFSSFLVREPVGRKKQKTNSKENLNHICHGSTYILTLNVGYLYIHIYTYRKTSQLIHTSPKRHTVYN